MQRNFAGVKISHYKITYTIKGRRNAPDDSSHIASKITNFRANDFMSTHFFVWFAYRFVILKDIVGVVSITHNILFVIKCYTKIVV